MVVVAKKTQALNDWKGLKRWVGGHRQRLSLRRPNLPVWFCQIAVCFWYWRKLIKSWYPATVALNQRWKNIITHTHMLNSNHLTVKDLYDCLLQMFRVRKIELGNPPMVTTGHCSAFKNPDWSMLVIYKKISLMWQLPCWYSIWLSSVAVVFQGLT